jgi:hypothetical protein
MIVLNPSKAGSISYSIPTFGYFPTHLARRTDLLSEYPIKPHYLPTKGSGKGAQAQWAAYEDPPSAMPSARLDYYSSNQSPGSLGTDNCASL